MEENVQDAEVMREMRSRQWAFVDVLAAIGCLAVVALHVNGCFWEYPNCRNWWFANLIEVVFYFGAPIFFMISGCTLIDYRERYSTAEFFKRRFLRICIPYLFWSLIATLTVGCQLKRGALAFFYSVFSGSGMPIYWFFLSLFACYFCMPFLSAVRDKNRMFGWMIVYTFVSISCFGFVGTLWGHPFFAGLANPLGHGVIVLALIGYWIGHFDIGKRWRFLLYALGVFGLCVHFGGTYVLTKNGCSVSKVFKGYTNWPCVLYSSAVYCWARYHNWECHPSLMKVVKVVREQSFPVYLLHGFLVYHIVPSVGFDCTSVCYRLLAPFMIVAALVAFAKVVKKIPFVKIVLP